MSARRYAVIAGGGTAGHVFVALATARALSGRGIGRDEIELVGSSRGQEAALAGEDGFAMTLLPVSYTHLDVYKRQALHRYGIPTSPGAPSQAPAPASAAADQAQDVT